MTDEDYKILKNINRTTRQKPNNKIELLRLLFLLAKKIYGGNVRRKAFSYREGKQKYNYSIIYFNDAFLYLCLKRIDPNNPRLCPYIKKLINNDDFNNIKINNDNNEIEHTKQDYILPYKKINIEILKNDFLNH
ncbi:MAG: hypothetical protein ACR2IJ_09810 [Fluviibacter sp.]